MKLRITLATILVALLIAPVAFPCGAPFGNGINVDPKQDIIVVHKDGAETYVFQPRFCGSASQFGLILPVPSQLSVQPALSKAEVFKYLTSISQPTITYSTECSGRNGASGSADTGSSSTDSGTTLVSSGSVGFMDYAQLKADSVSSFTDWLTANGYPYDDLATSAFGYYVNKSWYFVAFKVDQGAFQGNTTCKDLGPIKLSFPTSTPVVPTRMATARSRDTTGSIPYSTGFSWGIYGVTAGTEQVSFTDGTSATRVLNYSGLAVSTDISHLDSLVTVGDRIDKLTVTFDYGSTNPDIALTESTGQDYRQVINKVSYVYCADSGILDATASPDLQDAGASVGGNLDAEVITDASALTIADMASALKADTATLSSVNQDAASSKPTETSESKGNGCSFSGGSGGLFPALFIALLLGIRRRLR